MHTLPHMLNLLGAAPPEVVTLMDRAGAALPDSPWLAAGYLLGSMAIVVTMVTLLGLGLIYMERRIAALFQLRIGPNRVGPFGLLQTVNDALKLLLKEDVVPEKADKLLHTVAPFIALITPVVVLALIPYGPLEQLADVNIGILFVSAVSGFGVLGVLLAGWSSNNKWSTIGAMRAGAQIISYELSASIAVLVAVLFSGTLTLSEIVQSQQEGWWIWRAPIVGLVAFTVHLIASMAEINRLPFDIPEGESELAAGFHTEYSGIRFSFFFLAEFVNMFTISGLTVTLFLGGWMPFHVGDWAQFNQIMDHIPAVVWFSAKTFFIIFVIMWVRWTFPRLRVDQLMYLEWKFLLPISFVNLLLAALAVLTNCYFFPIS